MFFFASFPSPKPQQAQIVQVTAPPISQIFPTPTSSKRNSSSSLSSVFSSLGFSPQNRRSFPTTTTIPPSSKCTHLSVTRIHTSGATPPPSYPRDLFVIRLESDGFCQRCRKPHLFRWVYVCDYCSARACHNCRPRWADRAWESFGSVLGAEPPQKKEETAASIKMIENAPRRSKTVGCGNSDGRRRSKRWSGGSWLSPKELT